MKSNNATKAARVDARTLASVLFKGPCSDVVNDKRCFDREEHRPLTRAEKDKGWARRPFSAYDPDKMCRGCAAYFHAECAALRLDEACALGADVVPDDARETVYTFLLRVGCPIEALKGYRQPPLLDEPIGGLVDVCLEDVAAISHALEHLTEPGCAVALWTAVLEQIRTRVFG